MRVCSIIVCYRPNLDHLKSLCATIKSDGSQIILLDNSETPMVSVNNFNFSIEVVSFQKNTGLAHAQNVGIKIAIAAGADIIVFFDQDSTISDGFIQRIIEPIRVELPDILAPLCIDNLIGAKLPSLRISRSGFSSKVFCGLSAAPYDVDIVISSGTAATSKVFEIAGYMDETLFIDHVDTEWCLRCRKLGIPIRVVPSAVMHHRIGNHTILDGPFTILAHNPLRCYYQIRNSIHLFRKSHIPKLFAVRELLSILLSRMLLLRHVSGRIKYIRAYAYALRDGLLNVAGPPSPSFLKNHDK